MSKSVIGFGGVGVRGRGHILCAGFCPLSPCKMPPIVRRYYQRQKDKIDGRTKAGKPCARSRLRRLRLRRLRLPCTLAPVRLFAVAVAVHVRPLHPKHPPKKHPHTQKASRKTHPKRGRKPPQKMGVTTPQNTPPEKSRANFDTRITHTRTRALRACAPARS